MNAGFAKILFVRNKVYKSIFNKRFQSSTHLNPMSQGISNNEFLGIPTIRDSKTKCTQASARMRVQSKPNTKGLN